MITKEFYPRKFGGPEVLTPEEIKARQYQHALLGIGLKNQKYFCPEKVATGFKNFAHGREKFLKIGIEDDGRHFVQIVSINHELKAIYAQLTSDKGCHEFLADCYVKTCEIYKKRLEASAAALKFDQDFGKFREEAMQTFGKNLSEMRADQEILRNRKKNKTMPPFDKNDYKTWSSLSPEDTEASKDRLTKKKTDLLKKISDIEERVQQFTTELEAFQGKVDALKSELEAAKDESEYKNIRLSFDYNELQLKKLQKKIANNNEEKANLQAELEGLDKQVSVLECIADRYQLTKDIENWENRRERAVERVVKAIKDCDAFYIMRENLNARWNELTTKELPKKEASAVSPYRQSAPIKLDELCERLPLKASATNYFI